MIGARDMAFPRLNAFGFWVDAVRRPAGLLQLRHRRCAGDRLVRLRAADRTHVSPAAPATDFWALGLIVSGIGTIDGRRQLHRHDPRHARPGHDAAQGAVLRLDDALDRGADPARHPAADRGAGHGAVRPPAGRPFLRRAERRLGLSVAAPVLVLRPSGGLHPDPAGLRHGLRSHPGLLAQGAVRLRVHGRRHDGHRLHQPGRLGASHVLPSA